MQTKSLIILLCLFLASIACAKVDSEEQQKLFNELTPFGALKQGNGDGIPQWTGSGVMPQDETPLFIITKDNYVNYQDKLSAGQVALFAHYAQTFSMPVYATYRTAIAPQWVYENTQSNAIHTELNVNMTGFFNAKAGIAFPIPQTALEVYFNHVSRWRGLQLKNRASDAMVYKNGSFTLFTRETIVRFDGYIEEIKSSYFVSLIAKILAPATKSGGGILLLEPLDQANEARSAWIWDKGRRRVIRAPKVAYDNPVTSAASMRTVDDTDLISGAPDYYDWQLLGKKELYIPYNNEALSDKALSYADILHKNHINPALSRYELHRVWVIEATLKPKLRHIYSKRRFYLDEDSWHVVAADQYNKQGKLWRVSLSYPKFYPQMPGVFPVINVFHDLLSQQYHVMGLQNEENSDNQFNGELAADSLFTPAGFERFMR